MSQVQRLLGFLRPYRLRLTIAVLLMAVVGACEAITALLIKPIGDNVLKPNAESSGIRLFDLPWNHHTIYLQDFFPHPQRLDHRRPFAYYRHAGEGTLAIPSHGEHQFHRPVSRPEFAQPALLQNRSAVDGILQAEPYRPPDVGDQQ